VLNRLRAEQGNTTSERIALLKLYLDRKTNNKGGKIFMSTLDESNKNIAYTCGRLFAVLESIQYHASGGNLNAGIRERFFSSASTTPSTAFGRLIKLSQHHLSKIRGEKPGLAVNLDKQLQELMCNVEGSRFPVTFSLEDQASFAIGYYHQRQHDFAK
jgi:CRISPR-associated protein Csd1